MSDMVEVVIDSIRVSLMSQQRIVILREADDERYLPIWIGIYEAEAITLSLQEVEVARPLTWDLLKNVLTTLDARVLKVEVVALKEDTFYGNIVIEVNGKEINIDSRPSDALALAVRSHVPIFVNRSIMDMAGITPEEDLQEKGEEQADEPARAASRPDPVAESNEGLEIFEDFFEKLDLDDMDDDGEDEAKTP